VGVESSRKQNTGAVIHEKQTEHWLKGVGDTSMLSARVYMTSKKKKIWLESEDKCKEGLSGISTLGRSTYRREKEVKREKREGGVGGKLEALYLSPRIKLALTRLADYEKVKKKGGGGGGAGQNKVVTSLGVWWGGGVEKGPKGKAASCQTTKHKKNTSDTLGACREEQTVRKKKNTVF